MKPGPPGSFGVQLRTLREAAGFTQEELATIAGLSVHGVSALERGHRRRPQLETVRALSAALDLTGPTRDAFLASARASALVTAVDELSGASLPLPLTALLGRESDVQVLRQWLAEPAFRLVTIVGPGGVGKTRLALELAREVADEGSIRVVFVPLACIGDPGLVACAIADALGLAVPTAADLPSRAGAACEGHPTLLVLDNFEQVLDAAPLITALLTSISVVRLLVTSRAPLRVRGEREYALGPLTLKTSSEPMTPADMARLPAVRLFVERVREVQPGFRLTAANNPIVTGICRRLDALPLALELAAPWMKVLTAEDLLRRLEQDPLFSTVGPNDLPERQRTMTATVAWSYQLLDSNTQRAFRRLGALPGRFSIDAAATVLAAHDPAEALGALATLIDRSLLLRAESSVATRPLYQMLDTVRAYAARELTAAGGFDDAMECLTRYCTGEASLAAEGLVGPAQAEWLNRVHEDLENYRSALTWLIERGRATEASDIAWGVMFFWLIRGQAAEGLSWYQAVLTFRSLPPAAESRALLGAAHMWFTQGEFGRARTALTHALALAHATGDMNLVARAEDLSARVEQGLGNLTAARDWFTRAIERFQALAIAWGAGNARIGLVGVAFEINDDDEAERLLDEAASVLRDAGPWFVARELFVRGFLAVRRGDPDEAIVLVRESLTRIRDLHDKFAFVHALVPLAAAAALKGDAAWAARILGARDVVAESTGARIVVRPVSEVRAQVERDARRRLGSDRWAEAYGAGRQASIDSLLNDIDSALASHQPA
ncbi:MAG TPA: helix-turn-helix domain-containing protein [Vicinamibacterales bacterium]|nr:helix-turn-helix domain-containing protein [Vicinamibacterales bacterium]